MNTVKLLLIIPFIFLTAFHLDNTANQSDTIDFNLNQSISLANDEDICEGSCVSAGSWQYCVVYSEMRWGQRNRTAQEAEDCDKCTGTEPCED